jgi:hypothetical protein
VDEIIPGKWVGRDGPISWAPPAPDINPMNFFLRCYAKKRVFYRQVCNMNELHERMTCEIASVLENTWRETEHRLDVM